MLRVPVRLIVEPEQTAVLMAESMVVVGQADYYDGPYEFTPTQGTQTISIDGKTATQDIVINPIPSNYGLITWNGSTLTVS